MIITIPGKPIPKNRPRFSTKGKYPRAYSDQKKQVEVVQIIAKQYMRDHKMLTGAVAVSLEFFMPIPKNTPKKKRELMLLGVECHTKKPDLDNLEKFILDSLNGITWKDDSQIIETCCSKEYGDTPRTRIKIIDLTA